MSASSPTAQSGPLGQRMLAAIMFTDVVGFSRQAEEDEERALRLTQRDLQHIADACRRFRGRVIKNTGDGCLAVFSSGVQAVECAQEIQRHFAEQAHTMLREEILAHRIGIHLGDVYHSGDEVLGDGVNIAARLQAEAPPGGICITQALYEVVKTRLALQTIHLGTKQLKNISEAIQIYRVLIPGEAEPTGLTIAPTGRTADWLRWVSLAVLLLAVAAFAIFVYQNTIREMPVSAAIAAPTDTDESAVANPVPLESSEDLATSPLPTQGRPTPVRDRIDQTVRDVTQTLTPIELLRRFDRDTDGRLVPGELPEPLRSRLMRADANGDQALTRQELESARGRLPPLPEPPR